MMIKTKGRQYASMMLDKLKGLDRTTQEAYYEMGRILHSMWHDKLWEDLEYPSLLALVEEELSFGYTTATKYRQVYQNFRRLKYNKNEAVQLLDEFGYTHMAKVLPDMRTKVGKRAIKTRIDNLGDHQLNFTVFDEDYKEVRQVFEQYGVTYSESGRMANASAVFMDIVEAAKKLMMDVEKKRAA
jgi:hypothetical protein